MPELPEVEVIKRGLIPHLVDRKITTISYNSKSLRTPVNITKMIELAKGVRITSLERRAKYILVHLANGAAIVIHLGMTGNLGIFHQDSPLAKHDHLQFSLNDHNQLRYNDIRRFGSIHILSPAEVLHREQIFFKTSGLEPFDQNFTEDYVQKLAKGKGVSVKQFLMNSQIVVGIGNIYANESLFRAGIHPEKPVSQLNFAQWERLITTIQKVLNHAIDCGGSTINDFLNASQEQGYFQMNFAVYGKDGTPCPSCGTSIAKSKIGGRATYYCEKCQT